MKAIGRTPSGLPRSQNPPWNTEDQTSDWTVSSILRAVPYSEQVTANEKHSSVMGVLKATSGLFYHGNGV
jgi:hypothetical protein